jgi:hypothetical protein
LRKHRHRRPSFAGTFCRWKPPRRCCLRPRVPASARQSENVPVSYPRDAELVSGQTTKRPICRAFSKPSCGLEPQTPSLPWRFPGGTGGHGRPLAITFLLQIAPSRRVWRARACPRVTRLMYPSRTRGSLSVCKTSNRGWNASDHLPADYVWADLRCLWVNCGLRRDRPDRAFWGRAELGGDSRREQAFSRSGPGIGGRRRGLPATSCGMCADGRSPSRR